jgi:hypothetical protein
MLHEAHLWTAEFVHLGRICAVLIAQKYVVGNFPVFRIHEELTFTHLVKKFPVVMENQLSRNSQF